MSQTSTRRPYKRCDICGIGERKALIITQMRAEQVEGVGTRIFVQRRCPDHLEG